MERKVDRLGQTVINGEIVPANWFKRQWGRIWDFIYFNILPIRTWSKLIDCKNAIKYGFQRMFRGHDRTISWGYESSIKFYKQLLSDLIENAHGFPSFDLSNVCPEHWKSVDKKWKSRLLRGAKYIDCYAKDKVFKKEFSVSEFEDDVFNCWLTYLNYVLHCFMEADPDTCSLTPENEELLKKIKPPFDRKDRKVVEANGVFVYQYPHKPFTKTEKKIHDRMSEIEKYQTDKLQEGMKEVAKNILLLND